MQPQVGDALAEPPAPDGRRYDFAGFCLDPQRRLLTLTVSEGGYYVSPRTGRLDVDDPALRADLEGAGTPRTVIGLLARGLAARAEGGEPFTVLPCDNVSAAGRTARRMVEEFLELSSAPEDVLRFVREHVSFPDAMVDRIVPATTAATTIAPLIISW